MAGPNCLPRRSDTSTSSLMVVSINEVEPRPRSGVAIGFFDGVHLGHRSVIEGCETVLTFDRHPMSVLKPAYAPKLLMDLDHRIAALAALGVKEVALIPFDRMWATLSADGFIDRVLRQRLRPQRVSVGANFRFGARAQGSAETLGTRAGFPTRVVDLAVDGGQVVSSTRIRGLVAVGDVEQAAHLMCGALERVAVRTTHAGLRVESGLAMPPAGRYHVLIDGQPGTVSVNRYGHVLAASVDRGADRMTIRFRQRVS